MVVGGGVWLHGLTEFVMLSFVLYIVSFNCTGWASLPDLTSETMSRLDGCDV